MRHAWRGGADANDPERLRALHEAVAPARDPQSEPVKAELRAHTEVAIERGVFGVPTFELAGRLFWGLDALPMLRAALLGDAFFDGPAWEAAAVAPPGVVRGGG
jgi:2-hydroxychromene-2-carboxylate isomerase